jgi:hypothetical protein
MSTHPFMRQNFGTLCGKCGKGAADHKAKVDPVVALADVLHYVEDSPAIEGIMCWCRRIATTDGTHDGPQDDNWNTIGDVYDPKAWGSTAERPTACEQSAKEILDLLKERA